ncbi:MAG: hypothetical protein GWN73_36555 [Actinobacteria bacterium]|nr:hypothetical protein [Actinomycetota bacterium]NIU70588.1 hypothetical protein [Actinomycetota bacterium]NIW32482.1 hypothetical protein [Actinomycetota bacterium]
MIHIQRGDEKAAVEAFDERMTSFGDSWSRATACALWAMVAEGRGEHEPAATLWGHFDALRDRSGLGLPRYEQEIMEASQEESRAAIGTERFDELVAAGGDIAWDDLPLVHGSVGV